jgi:CheY-like chemotaxis protein
MHVLIVDNEPLAQIVLSNILANGREVEGFDTANDAVEALKKIMRQSYDVLLLNISMPELSGFELLVQLKARDSPLPSVVLVTACQLHAHATFKKHAVDSVLKPFSNEGIEEALEVAVRGSAGKRDVRSIET